MKKLLAIAAVMALFSGPASAWYDGYGGWHNEYLDPVTSFLDGIFGPPVPVQYYVPYAVPVPVPVPVPVYPAPPLRQRIIVSPPPPPPPPPCQTQTKEMFDSFGRRVYTETIENC